MENQTNFSDHRLTHYLSSQTEGRPFSHKPEWNHGNKYPGHAGVVEQIHGSKAD